MIFPNAVRDFLAKSYVYTQQNRIKELNYLEAELIMLDEDLITLKGKGTIKQDITPLQVQISRLKLAVKDKKKTIMKSS
jgi:site-specific recombinase XerC